MVMASYYLVFADGLNGLTVMSSDEYLRSNRMNLALWMAANHDLAYIELNISM